MRNSNVERYKKNTTDMNIVQSHTAHTQSQMVTDFNYIGKSHAIPDIQHNHKSIIISSFLDKRRNRDSLFFSPVQHVLDVRYVLLC